jgi:hypothetical protein
MDSLNPQGEVEQGAGSALAHQILITFEPGDLCVQCSELQLCQGAGLGQAACLPSQALNTSCSVCHLYDGAALDTELWVSALYDLEIVRSALTGGCAEYRRT